MATTTHDGRTSGSAPTRCAAGWTNPSTRPAPRRRRSSGTSSAGRSPPATPCSTASGLSHLVLVDTLGLAWFRPAPSFALPMVRFVARPTERSRDRLFRQCFLDFGGVGARFGDHWDDLRAYALDRARDPGVQAAVRTLLARVGMAPVPADDLTRIPTPTTLVHGRHDLQVPLRAAERASARTGWPLHVIEDARDDPAAEQPRAFLAALSQALDQHDHDDVRHGTER